MDKEFYNLAVKLMDNIRQLEPNLVSARDAELCVLMTESQQIYAGITSVKISAGQLMRACPEYNAIMAMVPEGESRVLKLITVSFSHKEVSQPCEGCLELLCRVNKDNVDTEIYIAANRSVAASELMPELVTDAPEVTVPSAEETAAEAPAEGETAAETPAEGEAAAETPAEGEAATEAPAEGEAATEAPAEGEAAAEAPAEGEAAAEAPAEGEAAAEAPAEGEAAAETPAEGEAAAAEKPAEDDKPKDDFAQFGFEEADGDFATHVEIDKDNPFAAESGAIEAPKVMTPPPTMFDKPQSGYLDNPEAQSGYQQQASEMSGSNMYASQPLPGQQQSGGVFQPMQQQPFQPMQQQPFQPMQQQPFQPMQQQSFQPMQQQPFQPMQQQDVYQQQGGFPQQQVYQQQGGFPQQQVYQQQGGFPQQQGAFQQQSTQFQPNPQQQTSSHYSHNASQYQQSTQFQPNPATGAQYASQPLPGSTYLSQTSGGIMTASQPLPGSGNSVQQPAQKEAGAAFKERLNAYVDEEEKPKEKPLSKAEMMRQAKEKKKMAKIDADFKKQMKKKGL